MIAVQKEEYRYDEEEKTESIKFDDDSRNAWEEPRFRKLLYLTFTKPLPKPPSKRGESFHGHCINSIMPKVSIFKVNFEDSGGILVAEWVMEDVNVFSQIFHSEFVHSIAQGTHWQSSLEDEDHDCPQ
jgi:hypothetical protein